MIQNHDKFNNTGKEALFLEVLYFLELSLFISIHIHDCLFINRHMLFINILIYV